MKTHLVTGGGGFIGSRLIEAILASGARVRSLDLKPLRISHPNLDHYSGSFLDADFVRAATLGIDTIYHLAATNFPRESNLEPLRDAEENLIGSLQLLDIASKMAVRRFVFTSSGGTIYGPTIAPLISEDHPTNPISAYGICKLSFEKYLRFYAARGSIETIALRLANPYGAAQDIRKAQGALTTFAHHAVMNETIEIWGDGSVERDFIHIDDVVSGILASGRATASGLEVNIGSSEGASLNRLIAEIERALGRSVRVTYKDSRHFDVPRNCLDIELAKSQLGWCPKVGLREGITRLLIDMLAASGMSGPVDAIKVSDEKKNTATAYWYGQNRHNRAAGVFLGKS
jgi:UDP-glucose 4-epimerase